MTTKRYIERIFQHRKYYRKCFMLIIMITFTHRDNVWQNAQLVEKMLKLQRKLGKWQANQTKKEKEHNLLSHFMIAAVRRSEKF